MPFQPKRNKVESIEKRREYRARYDDKRGNAASRGYDHAWQMVRLHHLQENPLCADCLQEHRLVPAKEVHHKIKLIDRPDMRDDPDNLLALCKSCHSKRTADGQ